MPVARPLRRRLCLIGLAVTVLVAEGCSSGKSGTAGSPSDSGADAPQTCDASLALGGDSGAAVCAECQVANCAPSLAECGGDCVCAMAVACLQMNDNNYSLCSSAIDALSNGNTALTHLAACTVMNCCNTPCFPPNACAGDAGGGG